MPDPDATPMQLEERESAETQAQITASKREQRRVRRTPAAHRPRTDPHRGKAKMSVDYFLARATDPQHTKAVLNCLDFQSVQYSAMVVKGGDPYALAVALEAIKFASRTRMIIMSDQENAVQELSGHDQGKQNA